MMLIDISTQTSFSFFKKNNIDITSVLPKARVSIDSNHDTVLGHYQYLKTGKACTKLFY